ncbi:MAG: FAD-binding oxidoreductase [Pseudomonadota bacterium]|nr:FAD-binding oxidoreductase [Pseudomonadota bacterium]
MTKPLDVLIVGAGLAGLLIAWELNRRGWGVGILRDRSHPPTSRIATGLINPVTGPRLAARPDIKPTLASAERCYRELGRTLGRAIYEPIEIRRICKDSAEIQRHRLRSASSDYQDFLGPWEVPGSEQNRLHDPEGSFKILGGARVRLDSLLDGLTEYFEQRGAIVSGIAEHSYSSLHLQREIVRWHALSAKRIIFCEGWRVLNNPWFDWLPIQPAKGELLTVVTEVSMPKLTLIGEKTLLPLGNNQWRISATYDREHIDTEPTDAGARSLVTGFKRLLREPVQVRIIAHEAGIRPGTPDRYPLIGCHPEYPQLTVFNGLGSRGALLTPLYATALADHLSANTPLPPQADVVRYHAR